MGKKKSEPPIKRRFVAQKGSRRVEGVGEVDTGATASNLSRTVMCQLVPTLPNPNTFATTSGGDVGGNLIEVLLRVGKRKARIKAFVPAVLYLLDGSTQDIEGHNLIGLDFLRTTKAVLDFRRRRGSELLQGFNPDTGHIISFRPMTKREAALAAHVRCPKTKTKSTR
jgi:hypothetical protein